MPNNKKILILEDDAALTKTLSEILGKKGFEVLNAADGETGIKVIKEKKPDLIVLDIILPRKSGFEVMKELSADDELKKIPVLVLTNLEASQEVDRMMELGARSYLVKANYSLEEVVKKIKELV